MSSDTGKDKMSTIAHIREQECERCVDAGVFFITSRVSGRGHRIEAVCVCVRLSTLSQLNRLCVCLCPSWQKDYRAKALCMRGTREVSQRSGVFIWMTDSRVLYWSWCQVRHCMSCLMFSKKLYLIPVLNNSGLPLIYKSNIPWGVTFVKSYAATHFSPLCLSSDSLVIRAWPCK